MAQTKQRSKSTGHNVTQKNRRGKNWVIAVDPFSDLDPQHAVNFAKSLVDRVGARLTAIYVLAPSSFNWTGEFSGPWFKRYRPFAEEKMAALFKDSGIEHEVILCRRAGLRESVRTLVKHAEKIKAGSLIVSTHGRTGLERLALGSFAETVVLASSKVPVMVINPEHSASSPSRKILVPTDLSKPSRKFVLSLSDFAKGIGAEVLLYYLRPDPLDPIVQQGVYSLGGGWVSAQSFMAEEDDRSKKELSNLATLLRKNGVRATECVDSTSTDLVSGINQTAAQNSAELIALVSQAGAWSATLLGSVARGLIRSSSVPLLIQR